MASNENKGNKGVLFDILKGATIKSGF